MRKYFGKYKIPYGPYAMSSHVQLGFSDEYAERSHFAKHFLEIGNAPYIEAWDSISGISQNTLLSRKQWLEQEGCFSIGGETSEGCSYCEKFSSMLFEECGVRNSDLINHYLNKAAKTLNQAFNLPRYLYATDLKAGKAKRVYWLSDEAIMVIAGGMVSQRRKQSWKLKTIFRMGNGFSRTQTNKSRLSDAPLFFAKRIDGPKPTLLINRDEIFHPRTWGM